MQKHMIQNDIANGAVKNEISIHRELKHENVVEYVDAFITDAGGSFNAGLYMEYSELGNLEQYLQTAQRNRQSRIGEPAILSIFKQLAGALTYLQYGIHRTASALPSLDNAPKDWVGVIHRDIKPANIFLRSRKNGSNVPFPDVVLGDFGRAIRENESDPIFLRRSGDTRWAAPETKTHGYTYPADVWAVGAVIQAACRLETETKRVGPNPKSPWGRVYWGLGEHYSRNLDEMVRDLMCPDPDGRPPMCEPSSQPKTQSQQAYRGPLRQRR